MAHTLSAKIEALIGDARDAHHDDRTIAAALEEAAAALRAGLTYPRPPAFARRVQGALSSGVGWHAAYRKLAHVEAY